MDVGNNEGIVNKNMYSDDSYIKLHSYLEGIYAGDTEPVNYADVLLSMKNEKKVRKLVKKYNTILKKILLIFYSSEEFISDHWIKFMPVEQQRLLDELNSFLNEQIKRVFDGCPYSDGLALECIVNLRKGLNDISIRDYIVSMSSEEVEIRLNDIITSKRTVHEAPDYMTKFNLETNGYKEYKPKYIRDIKFLIKNGYRKDYNDYLLERHAQISYFPDYKSLIGFILAILVLLPTLFILFIHLYKAIFFILCCLAVLKMIK